MKREDKLKHAPHLRDLYLTAMQCQARAKRLDVMCVILGMMIYLSVFVMPIIVLWWQGRLWWQ